VKTLDVIESFLKGNICSNRKYFSDGEKLFYGNLVIGETWTSGQRVLYDYGGGKDALFIDQSLSWMMTNARKQGYPIVNLDNLHVIKEREKLQLAFEEPEQEK
jgi:hypothetical protein